MRIKIDKVSVIALFLLIIGCALIMFYFYTEKVSECTSDPVKFTINKITESTDAKSVVINILVDGKSYTFENGVLKNPMNNISYNISI